MSRATEYSIRVAGPMDADAIFDLARQFATSFVVEAGAFQQAIATVLSTPDAHLLVAEHGTEIVGYLLGFDHWTFYANGRVAWVEELMVAAEFRRQGMGQMLLHNFERWAAARGATVVALATRRAASFYRAVGYEESAIYFRKLL